jgi:hypothetical protein
MMFNFNLKTYVYQSVESMHNYEKFWDSPNSFSLLRWIKSYSKETYLPFGTENDTVGKSVIIQVKTFLILFLLEYQVEKCPNHFSRESLKDFKMIIRKKNILK